jgi:hypothetical protein
MIVCLRYVSVYEFNNLLWKIPSEDKILSASGVLEVSDRYRISDMYDLNVGNEGHIYFRCYPTGKVVDCLDRGVRGGRSAYSGKFATISYFDYVNWLTGREHIILSAEVDGEVLLTKEQRLQEIRNNRLSNRPFRGVFSILNWAIMAFSFVWFVLFLRWGLVEAAPEGRSS